MKDDARLNYFSLLDGLTRSSLLDQESTRLRSLSLINSIRFACIIELVSIRLCSIPSGSLDQHALPIRCAERSEVCTGAGAFDLGWEVCTGAGLESEVYSGLDWNRKCTRPEV